MMSEPLSMKDLTVKFRSNRVGVSRGETTIWQPDERAEMEQLHPLRTRLIDLQAAGKRSPPPGTTAMP